MAKVTKQTRGAKPSKASVAAAEAPDGKGKGSKPKAADLIVPKLSSKAMQTSIGPQIVASLATAHRDEMQANALMAGVKTKRYDAMALLTQAIVKVMLADKSIDPAILFNDDAKAQRVLNEQIGEAIGIRVRVKKGNNEVLDYAPSVKQFFVAPNDDKDSPEYKAISTFRTNFSTRLKTCERAAAGIIEAGHKVEFDKKEQTLRLSGPSVKKEYGADSVLLNERQKQTNKKGEEVELKARPSFTQVANKAGEAIAGTVTVKGGHGNDRSNVAKKPAEAIIALGAGLVQALNLLDANTITKAVTETLTKVYNAIEKKVPDALPQ